MLTFIYVAFKWLVSFLRSESEWRISDYPVRTRRINEGTKWFAQILKWSGPGGVGSSKKEAIQELNKDFESIRAYRIAHGEKMPRPGSRVPIEFAPTDRVFTNPSLHDDFITRILGFTPESPVFISDQSSLGDFGDESHVITLQQKIREVYGVDIVDLKGGLLCEIFERIQKSLQADRTNNV